MYYQRQEPSPIPFLIFVGFIAVLTILHYRKKNVVLDAYGTAAWCSEAVLRAFGMLCGKGLVLGRTARGTLIRIKTYVHVLLIGGSGSGKGVSLVTPNMLDYQAGGLVVFDPKGDLYETAQKYRKVKKKMIRFAPFNGGEDSFDPLITIPSDSHLLVDSARAMAEALVVRQGTEPDQHWNDSAAEVITAILVYVLLRLTGTERTLNSVQDIASEPILILSISDKLKEIGGIPARLGNKLKRLFDKDGSPTKEGTGVLNTMGRHLAFLDSQMVSNAMSRSTFNVLELLEPGNAFFLQIPSDQLESQRGLLRCVISTLIRVIGTSGHEEESEVLFLLDEASALGGLPAIKEALVRGRSAGVRLLLAYQSAAQVEAAFKDEKTLIYDNCSSHIWLLPPGSYETAERISKSCGDYTRWVTGNSANEGGSQTSGKEGSTSVSWGSSRNFSQAGRALLRPEEVLSADENLLIAFVRSLPGPVLAERVKYYDDPEFTPGKAKKRPRYSKSFTIKNWILVVTMIGMVCAVLIRAWIYGYGPWAPK